MLPSAATSTADGRGEDGQLYVEESRPARYAIRERGGQPPEEVRSGAAGRSQSDLERPENGLRKFQEQNQAIVLQDQTRGAIEAPRGSRARSWPRSPAQVMRSFATRVTPDIQSMRRRVEEMKRQLAQMQYGEVVNGSGGRASGRPPGATTPCRSPGPGSGTGACPLDADLKVRRRW